LVGVQKKILFSVVRGTVTRMVTVHKDYGVFSDSLPEQLYLDAPVARLRHY
jgi:hypothetical protein